MDSDSLKQVAEQVAERMAATIPHLLAEAGQPVTDETVSLVLEALKHQLGVSRPVERLLSGIGARKAWAQSEGLVDDSAARQVLGLSASEWQTALRLHVIQPVPVPEPFRLVGDPDGTHSGGWYAAVELTESERALIAENTLISIHDALLVLHMERKMFHQMRLEQGVVPVIEKPYPKYRLSDVLRLALPKQS